MTSSKQPVTELDLRDPKFPHNTKPEDYEFREDGAIVRKDRWEVAVHNLSGMVGISPRKDWEIQEVILAVEQLAALKNACHRVNLRLDINCPPDVRKIFHTEIMPFLMKESPK